MHLGFDWLHDSSKLLIWQQFCAIIYEKLQDAHEIDKIYFQILEDCAKKWHKTNPKRVAIEAIITLLDYEGKLYKSQKCFACQNNIDDMLTFARGFIKYHANCGYSHHFKAFYIDELFNNKTSILLSDDSIEKLWQMILNGFAN